MASIISTKTSGGGGIAVTGDTSGIMQLASNDGTTAVTIDASQNVGIGTSSPGTYSGKLVSTGQICAATDNNAFTLYNTAGSRYGYWQGTSGAITFAAETAASNIMTFNTNGTERMRIDANGNVGIGTSSPTHQLEISGGSGTERITQTLDTATAGLNLIGASNQGDLGRINIWQTATGSKGGYIRFDTCASGTNTFTERMRIDSSGNVLVAKTTDSLATAGISLAFDGSGGFVRSGGTCLYINRTTNDGVLVEFRQDNTAEGSISVSGTTVSYNAFAGSHWSQLQDGSKPNILRGTIMDSIDELVQWPDEVVTERLCKVKISDTAGSKKVYGVFMDWDNDWTATNDMMVTSLGAFICRVAADVNVEQGDLLESNGDGTARVQQDDVIRSSTIGKVTSTIKTHQYSDGSYCVPTVLYCG